MSPIRYIFIADYWEALTLNQRILVTLWVLYMGHKRNKRIIFSLILGLGIAIGYGVTHDPVVLALGILVGLVIGLIVALETWRKQ